MSEETENTESTENVQVTEQSRSDSKPAGYDPVDVKEASPEEIQQRLDYLYKQVKPTQRELKEAKQIMADQSRMIEELSSGMYAVVDHLQTDATGKAEDTLRLQMQQYLEQGNTAAYIEAHEKLTDLKIKKNQPKQQPPQKNETQKMAYAGAKQVADSALQQDEISTDDARYVETYQSEKDDNGRLLRPWSINKSGDANNPDPDFVEALIEARAVFTNKRYASWTMEQKLTELDKRMGVQKPTGGQTVMGGNLTARGKNTKITLSPKQQEIAIRTKYGSSKGAKTDADYMEAFRKQIESVKTGARK